MAEDMMIRSAEDAGGATEKGGEVANVEECEGFSPSGLSSQNEREG